FVVFSTWRARPRDETCIPRSLQDGSAGAEGLPRTGVHPRTPIAVLPGIYLATLEVAIVIGGRRNRRRRRERSQPIPAIMSDRRPPGTRQTNSRNSRSP